MNAKALCAITIVGMVAVPVSSAAEREKFHHRIYGDGVGAELVSVDTSTCTAGVETRVVVNANQGESVENGYHLEGDYVSVLAVVFDRCKNVELLSVFGSGPAGDFQLNPNLKSASLRTSLTGIDSSNNSVDITVDLVWNGAGRADRTSDQVRSRFGVYTYISNANGAIRDASAGGSVVIGALDVTPLPSTTGFIETDSTRSLTIYR